MTLKKKLTLAFLILSIVFFIVGFICFLIAEESLFNSVSFNLHSIAELREGQIYMFIEKAKIETKSFSSDGFIRGEMKITNHEGPQRTTAAQALSNYLSDKKTLDPGISEIDILDLKGKIVASTSPERVGLNHAKEPYFLKAGEELYLTDFHINSKGIKEFSVSSPIRAFVGSSTIGVLVNHYNTEAIDNVLRGAQVLHLVLGHN